MTKHYYTYALYTLKFVVSMEVYTSMYLYEEYKQIYHTVYYTVFKKRHVHNT